MYFSGGQGLGTIDEGASRTKFAIEPANLSSLGFIDPAKAFLMCSQMSFLGKASTRFMKPDSQRFASAAQLIAILEGPASGGRDDNVETVASVADFISPLARFWFSQSGIRQSARQFRACQPNLRPFHRGVQEGSDPLLAAGPTYSHGV